ncbi:hypothetical protein [Bradyrhizobium sp. cf659]|uniref:hypothetical protein n=1 Tax=Bradyrhizobium sp. cf659 TaxID=1761771 RepID=UPI0008E4667C|nr:hypothetical protein [Bradyrhizobium sp. cf659]SFI90445.1 hypothetical protein SAMN04487925_104197 [Bradyrhizobium sp. cf659]
MSSLIVIGRLDGMVHWNREGLFFNPDRANIKDLGFCDGLDQVISHRSPRPERLPYDLSCADRFLSFEPDDDSSSIGRVDVSEALVYDNQMHAEIDFTGFRVTVSLQRDAYQAYLNYVGDVRKPELGDQDSWQGWILLRIPSQPFEFPMPRGGADPWQIAKPVVGRLNPIKQFVFDEIEIQVLCDEQGRQVTFDDAARQARPGWQPALSLRMQRSPTV